MTTTPAQADEAVADALMARTVAYGNEATGVITGWFAVAAVSDYDDGEPVTRYLLATPSEQPLHMDLGFLAYATERVRSWTWPTE